MKLRGKFKRLFISTELVFTQICTYEQNNLNYPNFDSNVRRNFSENSEKKTLKSSGGKLENARNILAKISEKERGT